VRAPGAVGRLAIVALFVLAIPSHEVTKARRVHEDLASWSGAPEAQAQPARDAWTFAEDTEDIPRWRQVIGAQAVDLVLFPVFVCLALLGFFRNSVRLKYVTLAASVIYLGIFRSQLISIVNVFGLITWNLPIFRYSLAWYLFAAFTVASTVLWGRLYCGRICAYGALTQLLDTVVPAKLRLEPPPWLEQRAALVKYGLLAATVVYFLVTRDISIYRYVEPFWMFTGHGTTLMWIGLGILLLATVFVRNLYCRFLCPVGAFLGLLSNLTVFPIKRWSECTSCKICEKTCEWGAIQGPRIVKSECVRCDDCERLYMDTQRCPHWIIILRKQDKAVARARQSALSAGSGRF
jgi:NosR/NirI family nitrous oxide reductase transcriptional regulator